MHVLDEEDEEDTEYVPEGQAVQVIVPVDEENLPAKHAEQLDDTTAPVVDEYFPEGQATQNIVLVAPIVPE